MMKIQSEYTLNKRLYEECTQTIKKNIVGRSCHHKVVLLTVLRNILPIESYLEIGVHNGTSMSYILQNDKPLKHCIGIDLFEDTISRYSHDKLSYARTLSNLEKNNLGKTKFQLVKGNSFHTSTLVDVTEKLGRDKIDVLFIDGLHEYSGIKNDFETYSPLVKQGGLIILDDYEPKYPDILKYVGDSIQKNPAYKIVGVFENNELIIQKI